MPHTLPAPTWSQSGNNLLPQWIRFIEQHRQTYASTELNKLRRTLGDNRQYLEDYTDRVRHFTESIAECTRRLNALKVQTEPPDEETLQNYHALIASPHVIGTRTGSFGELVILVDPRSLGDEPLEYGVYELGYKFTSDGNRSNVLAVYHTADTYNDVSRYWNVDYFNAGAKKCFEFRFNAGQQAQDAIHSMNPLVAVDCFVERLTSYLNKRPREADRVLPWSGHHVDDPLRALRRLAEYSASTTHWEIEELTQDLALYSKDKETFLKKVRQLRVRIREDEAALAKLKALARVGHEVDTVEMRRVLRYISTIPSVMAIRFNHEGVPVLHVRASFTYKRKRYDLGDYELRLQIEHKHFGDVLEVRRTRVPLGGEYNQGWHPATNAFCFGGDRTREIYEAFVGGDIPHAVNVAIGTLNSISDGDEYLVGYGKFAEIPMHAVWQHKIPARPRRRQAVAA